MSVQKYHKERLCKEHVLVTYLIIPTVYHILEAKEKAGILSDCPLLIVLLHVADLPQSTPLEVLEKQ